MADLKKIKTELQAKLAELQTRVDAVDRHLSQPGLSDWEENATAAEDNDVLNEIGDATQRELHEVQLALHRIESGDYGKCTSCGQSISPARLAALPYATTCINCAQ